jgi:CheY-like chemotaxis protein
MARRIFVKVVGFSDVERHALNTVFRLSEDRSTSYALWTLEAPEPPSLALLDATAYESRFEAESPLNAKLRKAWIGDGAPAGTWCVFRRPISWPEVVGAIDELFDAEPIDFDLAFGAEEDNGPDTQPSQYDENIWHHALIASADRNLRLYLRARLSLASLPVCDEAEDLAQAKHLLATTRYEAAVLDMSLPGGDAWEVAAAMREGERKVGTVLLLKVGPTRADRARGRRMGIKAVLAAKPDPKRLELLLNAIRSK